MTPGQRMIAANLKAREAKAAASDKSSGAGAGTLGGRVQAWIDRVGRTGMAKYDPALGALSSATLDTLRTIDHATCPTNYDLLAAVVKHGATKRGGGGGAVLVFMPGLQEIAELIDVLHATLPPTQSFHILPLHSELTSKNMNHA